jgi:transcriptional regulator with XRE-family HTH domain
LNHNLMKGRNKQFVPISRRGIMIETPFGNLLGKYRERNDLNLEELAEKADVSPSYISLLIRGKKGRPRNQVIERLAQALELTEAEKLEFRAAAEVSRVDSSPNRIIQDLTAQLPNEAGIQAVHEALSIGLLKKYFGKANKVRIQDNWLDDVINYNNLFRDMLERDMLKKEKSDLVIQILLLDPGSALADFRQGALGMDTFEKGYIRQKIQRTKELFESIYKDFKDIYQELGRNFIEMRLFNVLPSVQHISFDEETIFIGFNSHTTRSGAAYQLQIQENSPLGNFFKKDFEKAWELAGKKEENLIIPKP